MAQPGLLELLLRGLVPDQGMPEGGGLLSARPPLGMTHSDRIDSVPMQGYGQPQGAPAAPAPASSQMPQQAPQQPQQAPQQVQMPQQQGGVPASAFDEGGGGLLGRLFKRGPSNQTVQYLINKGYDPSAATAIASDPATLRRAVVEVGGPQSNEYQQRQMALSQAGLDPNSEEGKRYFLTGNLPDGNEKLPSSAQEFEYARRNGYQGSYTDWQTKGVRDQDKGFGNEKDLAAQYSSDPNVKEYSIVRNNYERIRAGAQMGSGAGDIAIIFGYMKMLDPTSVVRENEQATAENAGGVPAQVTNLYNKLLNGDKLPPNVRQMYVQAAGDLYNQQSENLTDVNKRYGSRAGAWNVDPSHFTVNPEVYDPLNLTPDPAPQPGAPAAPAPAGQDDTPPPSYKGNVWKYLTPEERKLWQ